MNDIGGFTEEDLCVIFLVFAGMAILVSGLLFLIQEHLARRDQRALIETSLKPIPVAAPKHRPILSRPKMAAQHFQKRSIQDS